MQQPLSALNPLIKAAKTVDSTRNAHAHAQRTRATLVSYGHRPHEHRPHEHRPHEHRPHEHRPHEHTRSQAQACRRAGAGRTGAAACAQALAGAGCSCTLPGSVQFPAPGLPAASTNAGYPCVLSKAYGNTLRVLFVLLASTVLGSEFFRHPSACAEN